MRSPVLAAVLLSCGAGAAHAQRSLEGQVHGLVTVAARDFVGAGAGVAVRSGGRLRLALDVSAGRDNGALAGRGETLATFHLVADPRRGASPYVGGGVAVLATRTNAWEYLVLVGGVDGRSGWFVEAGVGGGLRAAAGWRFRGRRQPR